MPKLNIRNAGLVQGGGVNVQADPNAFGAQVGAAVSNLGSTLTAIGDVHQAKAEKAAKELQTNQARTQIHGYRADYQIGLADLKANNPNADRAAIEQFSTTFNEDYQKNNYLNPIATQAFDQNASDMRGKAIVEAIHEDAARALNAHVDSISNTTNKLLNIVTDNPAKLPDAIKEAQGLLSGDTLLKENARRDMLTKFVQDATANSFASRLDKNGQHYNPQGALADLTSGKFDNSLDAGVKKKLIAQATVKADEQNFTNSVGALKGDFQNPRDRLNYLTNTNPVDIFKRYGIKATNTAQLANEARSEITFARNESDRQQRDQKIEISKQISELVTGGDVAKAESLVRRSDAYPSITEKNAVISGIRSESAKIFDTKVFNDAQAAIMTGSLRDPSTIDALHTTRVNKDLLHSQLKDYDSNHGKVNFYKDDFVPRYKKLLKDHPSIDVSFGVASAIVLDEAKREKVGVFDSRFNDIANKLLKELPNTSSFFSRGTFGIEDPNKAFPQQKSTKPQNDTQLPVMHSIEEASKLQKGTRFQNANGEVFTK